MNQNLNPLEIESVETLVAATPRDDSRRAWLRHAGMVAGAVALAGTASRAMAQDAAPPATDGTMNNGTMNNGTMNNGTMNNGTMNNGTMNNGTMNNGTMNNGAMNNGAMNNGTMTTDPAMVAPVVDQEYASIVEDKATNPNHPEIVIPKAAKTAAPSDVEILNFALGLEYLEADFYARVVQAHQNRAYLQPRVYEVAQKLAADEASHVQAILDILGRAGATPVAKPQFQFPDNVFFAQLAFLDLAATLEVTGTGAYLGAAPKVKSSDALKFAASVYGVEARHTAIIRLLNGQLFAPSALETPLSVEEVTKRVAPFIIV